MEFALFNLDIVDGRSPEIEPTPEISDSGELCLKSIFAHLRSDDPAVRAKAIEDLDNAGYSGTGRPEDMLWVCPNPACEVEVPAYKGTAASLSEGISVDNPALIDCIES